ncbi:hypothetical protein SUGI_0133300 [Cryptomeria japonica]|nr:hypothetical protein SUGI_0133300 [Cryptomeria japonica]
MSLQWLDRSYHFVNRARRSVAQVPISMALIKDAEGITRRIGNHHPNLWDDDFLQSLSKSYDDPSYGGRAEKLIKEIKDMFNALHLNSSSADDLYQRLSMVDDVERLGIDRHFQEQALDDAKSFSTAYLKQDLQILSRWWTESGLAKLEFAHHHHVEFYFWAAGVCIEPKYSTFRIGFAKMSSFVTCLDDIYDPYGTLDELKIFTEAIKRWDLAYMEGLPEFMKLTFKAFDEGVRDMAQEAEKSQGRDTLDYARKAWEVYIDAYFQEAKWLAMGYIPSLEEYLENGKVSSEAHVVTLQPVLSLDVPISNDVLKEIDYPSRFNELLCLTLRLRGDTKNFKAEVDRGEVVSCITCYMKDHPGSIEEDAMEYLNYFIDEKLKELNWEYLKTDNVPITAKDHAYGLSKGLKLLYKERDGFSVSGIETKNLITKNMIEPVPM